MLIKTRSQFLARWPRAIVCLVLSGCSLYLGYQAVDLVRRLPGSPGPAVALSMAVMLGALCLTTVDLDIRWLRFLYTGRFPRASRLWDWCITVLLCASFAAVMVSLFFLSP